MTPAIQVEQVSKQYGALRALDAVSLTVERGEFFGLLGPNGAGKTTTIEICEGLTEPDAGDVEVLGRRWATDARALRERLGIQLQDTQLSDKLTVAGTLALFRSFYSQGPTVDDLIALVQLEDKRRARVGTLSGGQKQRLAVACALSGQPELIFLDEPTTGLDPQARRQMWKSSSTSGGTAGPSSSRRITRRKPSGSPTGWRSWTMGKSSRSARRTN